jgi:hypothetical protein
MQPKANLYNVTVKTNGTPEVFGVIRTDLPSAIAAVQKQIGDTGEITDARLVSTVHIIN